MHSTLLCWGIRVKTEISSLLLRILFQFLALFQFKHSLLFCLFSLAAFLFAFLTGVFFEVFFLVLDGVCFPGLFIVP